MPGPRTIDLKAIIARVKSWIPWVKAPVVNFIADDGTVYAAGIAFYALVSLVPLGACIVAIMGSFLAHVGNDSEAAQAEYIQDLLAAAKRFIPLLPEDKAREVLHGLIRTRGDLGLIGALGLLGAASQVVDAIRRATARLFEVPSSATMTDPNLKVWKKGLLGAWALIYKRAKNFLVIITLGFFVGGMRLMLTFASSLAQVLPLEWVQSVISSPPVAFLISQVTGFLFSFTGYVMMVFHLSRKTSSWRGRVVGGALFAILLSVAEVVFTNYFVRFSDMSLTYGSLASLVAIALWIFYFACVFLICAQLTAVVSNPARLHYERA